jgi:hypothetical protein
VWTGRLYSARPISATGTYHKYAGIYSTVGFLWIDYARGDQRSNDLYDADTAVHLILTLVAFQSKLRIWRLICVLIHA